MFGGGGWWSEGARQSQRTSTEGVGLGKKNDDLVFWLLEAVLSAEGVSVPPSPEKQGKDELSLPPPQFA